MVDFYLAGVADGFVKALFTVKFTLTAMHTCPSTVAFGTPFFLKFLLLDCLRYNASPSSTEQCDVIYFAVNPEHLYSG